MIFIEVKWNGKKMKVLVSRTESTNCPLDGSGQTFQITPGCSGIKENEGFQTTIREVLYR